MAFRQPNGLIKRITLGTEFQWRSLKGAYSTLYFVVDDTSRKQYEAAGMLPFSYTTSKGQIFVRKYVEVPEEILNDAESLRQWANESLQIAIKTKASKKK